MKLDPKVVERYPGFMAGYAVMSGLTVEEASEGLNQRKHEVFVNLKSKYGETRITEIPEVKLYRSFFTAMGADPSSYRPAPEYLLRRALGDKFPAILNLVDSCLLTTVEHLVTTGVYDADKIKGEAVTTLGLESKPFELINGRNLTPKPQEVVLRDNEKLLSAYTIGDAKAGMVTHKTTNALILLWNAPGISKETMEKAIRQVTTYARRYCGGHLEQSGILP